MVFWFRFLSFCFFRCMLVNINLVLVLEYICVVYVTEKGVFNINEVV